MISEEQFEEIKKELAKVKDLPTGWGGRRQNNEDDDKIDLFSIYSFDELITKLDQFDSETRSYYLKRWFVIRISDCDEFIFNQLPDVKKNPNKYSKRFDFIIRNFEFDIKGTRIPYKFKDKLDEVLKNPEEIIKFYYHEQSKGRRFGVQNRLFIVTIDKNNYFDEIYLRTEFDLKRKAFIEYIGKLNSNRKFFSISFQGKTLISDIIFIIKNKEEKSIKIASDILN